MRIILPAIVISQFLCTSVWFAGNSIISDIIDEFSFDPSYLAHITSAIQSGFITGTLVFAVFTIADRFSPSKVFFTSAVLAACFNMSILVPGIDGNGILFCRFLTGFFLAGIYPVGMKIASDHFDTGLGKSLGLLVGALVLGTALPHLLKTITAELPWRYVIYATSSLSLIGGLFMFLLVPDGPYRKAGPAISITAFLSGFKNRGFRTVSYGYFGHMWELYTFWAFVPVMLTSYNNRYPEANLDVSLCAFFIVASGAPACVISGYISQIFGVKKIAVIALSVSCLCCLLSPLFLHSGSVIYFLAFLFIWGVSVIADSPLFSTLVARNAPAETRGSSLTIVNCIGFLITVVSIQFIQFLSLKINPGHIYMFLALGPVMGIVALLRKKIQS